MAEKKKTGGLSGGVAGKTALCTVGQPKEGVGGATDEDTKNWKMKDGYGFIATYPDSPSGEKNRETREV